VRSAYIEFSETARKVITRSWTYKMYYNSICLCQQQWIESFLEIPFDVKWAWYNQPDHSFVSWPVSEICRNWSIESLIQRPPRCITRRLSACAPIPHREVILGEAPLFNVWIWNLRGCGERPSFCPNQKPNQWPRVQGLVRCPIIYRFTPYERKRRSVPTQWTECSWKCPLM